MFSGIVETTANVIAAERGSENLVRITVARPQTFDDIQIGDSICTDGVCLTVESFDAKVMKFALGPETLKVTGWSVDGVLNRTVNLERSLRLNDRLHGHLVTGHVDTRGEVTRVEDERETRRLAIRFSREFRPFLWAKGSVAIQGVSLTLNTIEGDVLSVGLIPETLKRTNLKNLKQGDGVNLEIDNLARGLVHWARLEGERR